MKIGLTTRGSGGLKGIAREAKAAEDLGFDLFLAPSIYGHDPVTLMTAAGLATSRIRLMTGVAPTFPKHPAAMASQAMGAGAASDGRFTLGIGLSHGVVVEGVYGMSFDRPAVHMREYLDILLPLLAGDEVDFAGEHFTYHGRLRVSDRVRVPTMIAAMGPVMLRLAGAHTDGTVLWMAGAKAIGEHVTLRITRAAEDAGRAAPEIVTMLPIALTSDAASARAKAEEQFGNYGRLPSYAAMIEKSGVSGPGGLALAGDEASLRAGLKELKDAGTTTFAGWPFEDGTDSRGRTRDFLASLAPEF